MYSTQVEDPDLDPYASGTVINWPPGSLSVIQICWSTDPDTKEIFTDPTVTLVISILDMYGSILSRAW